MPSTVAALLALLCSVLPVTGHAATEVDRIVAIVNDSVITASELEEHLSLMRSQLHQQQIPVPPTAVLRQQVLDQMVLTSIQMQMARDSGITVDDETLNRTLTGIASQNNLTLSGFRNVLEKDGLDFDLFRESIREEMTIRRLQQRHVDNRVNVSEQEIDSFLEQQQVLNDKIEYRLGHILITVAENAGTDEIAAARQQADSLVGQLRDGADFQQLAAGSSAGSQAMHGGDLGWRKQGELPTLFADLVTDMKTGDIAGPIRSPSGFHIIKLLDRRGSDSHIITQSHARHILIRTNELVSDSDARARLDALRKRIQQGEDFAALARQYSDDTASAHQGGDLGWISPGMMVPPFEKALDALQVGEISKPVRTGFGWHLIELLGRRQYDNTEEYRRNQAREQIFRRKVEEARLEWLNRIRSEAYVEERLDASSG